MNLVSFTELLYQLNFVQPVQFDVSKNIRKKNSCVVIQDEKLVLSAKTTEQLSYL